MDCTKDRKSKKLCEAHQHRIDPPHVCELCAQAANEPKPKKAGRKTSGS